MIANYTENTNSTFYIEHDFIRVTKTTKVIVDENYMIKKKSTSKSKHERRRARGWE